MTTQQTLTDQIRNIDVLAELKKFDVLDLQETFEKLDLPKLELPSMELPVKDFADARAQLEDFRTKFEDIVKDFAETAVGFAPATRRDIEQLESRVAAAEKAAKKPAAKKATARKSTAKKPAAKKAVAK